MIKNFFILGLSVALVVTLHKLDKVEKAYLEEKQANSWVEERVITLEEVPEVEVEEETIIMCGDPTGAC